MRMTRYVGGCAGIGKHMRFRCSCSSMPMFQKKELSFKGSERRIASVNPCLEKSYYLKTKALLRRRPGSGIWDRVFDDGHLVIDSDAYLVQVQGRRLKLTLKEFGLLSFLARNRGQVFSRDKLLDVVWERHGYPDTRTVDVHVRRIRMKLVPKFEHYIQTIVGVGYLFDPPSRLVLNASPSKEASA